MVETVAEMRAVAMADVVKAVEQHLRKCSDARIIDAVGIKSLGPPYHVENGFFHLIEKGKEGAL